MPEAYTFPTTHTASGRRNGRLAAGHPARLAATDLDEMVDATGVDPVAIEDVITGYVTTAGEQVTNIGRNMVLLSNLPRSVAGLANAMIVEVL